MADTRSHEPDDAEARLSPLAELARGHLPAAASPEAARASYLRMERARARRPALRALRWAPVAALAAAAAVVAVLRLAEPVPLGVSVAGGEVEPGGYLRAPADADSSLRFSDGTVVELERASRLRIAATTDKGARLLLDEGRARASVVPRRGARWLFDAGPCRVHVTGTRFEMRWSARDQQLDVWLESGSVTVEGPPARGGVGMHAGQHLAMDLREGTVRLDAAEGAAPARSTAAAASPAAAPQTAPRAAPPPSEEPPAERPRAPAAAAPKLDRSWPALVAAGDFAGVLTEAQRRGIPQVLRRDAAADVMALGDAARYAGSPQVARRALRAIRTRFPASPSAHRAAFLLGRMAEDGDGDLRRALALYATYLADGGDDDVYRAEALGRQMAATLRVHGVARARPLAAAYVQKYPQGAYAEAARGVLKWEPATGSHALPR